MLGRLSLIVCVSGSDLRNKAGKPVFVKRDMGVYSTTDLWGVLETGLKTGFYGAWHNGVSLSEFRLWLPIK